MFKKIFVTLLGLFSALCAGAVPAKPGIIERILPDGTTAEVMMRGDERAHIILSPDGYPLVDKDGWLYFAESAPDGALRPTSHLLQPAGKRSLETRAYLSTLDAPAMIARAEKALSAIPPRRMKRRGPGLFPGADFPARGKQKALVILVEYSDVKMRTSDANGYFTRLLNKKGFSEYGASGSVRDYMIQNSCGQFEPDFDVYGPVELPNDRAYYGSNKGDTKDPNAWRMIVEACQLLDDTIDFSEYDRNGDGMIDNVYLFYAGAGEASGGPAESVWPHAWEIMYATSTRYKFDGVTLNRYACSNEIMGGKPDGLGTFLHEFSHVMGLPDLYATSYTGAFTPGPWTAMDQGSYNNNSRTPPCYTAFERYALGWMEPVVLTNDTHCALPPIISNRAAIIPSSNPDEFFLLENRQKTGWDTYIPGHGMLVWHIDYDDSVWYQNTVNNDNRHQYVDIEEADGVRDEISRAGDSFPGTKKATSFSSTTTPAMRFWDLSTPNLPISEIAEQADGTVTFLTGSGGAEHAVETVAVNPVESLSDSTAVISWQSVPDSAATYLLSVYTRTAPAYEKNYLPGYYYRGVGAALCDTLTDLSPEVDYYFSVAAVEGLRISRPSPEAWFSAADRKFDRLMVSGLTAVQSADSVFTASWTPLEGAVDYEVSLSHVEPVGWNTQTADFNDSSLPSGWNATRYFVTDPEGHKSLSLAKGRNSLLTTRYNADIRSVSFWHSKDRYAYDLEGELVLKALTDNVWGEVKRYKVGYHDREVRDTIAQLPPLTRMLKWEFITSTEGGEYFLDDIEVNYGYVPAPVEMPRFTALSTAGECSFRFDGLTPGDDYQLRVRAIAPDALRTALTPPFAIHLNSMSSGNSGLDGIESSDVAVSVIGRSVTLSRLPAGTAVAVYDLTGRQLTAAHASADGTAELLLPSGGVAILSIPELGAYRKILVR